MPDVGVFDFFQFHNVYLIKYTVNHLLVVVFVLHFSALCNWHSCVVYFVSIGIKQSK